MLCCFSVYYQCHLLTRESWWRSYPLYALLFCPERNAKVDPCSCLGGHWSPLAHSHSGLWVGGSGRLETARKLMKSWCRCVLRTLVYLCRFGDCLGNTFALCSFWRQTLLGSSPSSDILHPENLLFNRCSFTTHNYRKYLKPKTICAQKALPSISAWPQRIARAVDLQTGLRVMYSKMFYRSHQTFASFSFAGPSCNGELYCMVENTNANTPLANEIRHTTQGHCCTSDSISALWWVPSKDSYGGLANSFFRFLFR